MKDIHKSVSLISLLLGLVFNGYCQKSPGMRWWDPALTGTIRSEGQGWPGDTHNFYSRLPASAAKSVRKDVFDLSQNNAGLILNFSTNSPDLQIAYVVKETMQFPHMPATGVSGIDLYVVDNKNNWARATGKYSFGDTVRYTFTALNVDNRKAFKLYLPLYNSVRWIHIGVDSAYTIEPITAPAKKPIVVYGTSIAQGACASRPGMAWTAILGRMMNTPIINLGFSGNGRLEPAVINYINELEARLYVLDCLPNIADRPYAELKNIILAAVYQVRNKHPLIPILLTEHLGFGDERTNERHAQTSKNANTALQDAYRELLNAGVTGLSILYKNEIGLSEDSFVDNIHPNDAGMLLYATAYKQKIENIR